ncbi:DUF7373 family lipoprotein [Nocardia yamanashiensis]|uniref:DUF7373 family lipoprotein n=1 Tax=Nocardia yamanashiensis TaxID=209247 RepID=UPI0008369B32|nr:hypothetical protein [Nocardia yamanashiensis]
MLSRRFRGAALALAAISLSACASQVDGSARPGEIDVRTLNVGKYATAPLEERYAYHYDMSGGFNLALARLADQVVTGPEIDPKFKYGTGSIPFLDSAKATKTLADVAAPVLDRNGLMFGVAVGHSEKEADKKTGKSPEGSAFTTVTVMQFPDAASAKQAADELDEADFNVAADRNERVSLSKYPEAKAHWRPGVASIGASIARGNYVVELYAGTGEAEIGKLTALAEQIYNAQLPLLDALPPLDREGVLRLPADPDGLLRRTLNADGIGTPDVTSQVTVGVRGYQHRISDQDYTGRVLRDHGVDRIAVSGASYSGVSLLYRTRDAETAGKLRKQLLERAFPGAAEAPAGVPAAECGESAAGKSGSGKRFRCALTYQRFTATVEADQLADVHQKAAAQYALLANSTW